MTDDIKVKSTVEILIDSSFQNVKKGDKAIVKRLIFDKNDVKIGIECVINNHICTFLIDEVKVASEPIEFNEIEIGSNLEVIVDSDWQQVSKGDQGIVTRIFTNDKDIIYGVEIVCNEKLCAFSIDEVKLV